MNVVAETRDGATALSKWTRDRFGEDLAVYWRWLVLYAFLLITGVLGELVSCAWAPSSVFWAQVLPQLHYLGVVLAALLFGVSGGLAAACLVGVAQITVISTACHQTTAYT